MDKRRVITSAVVVATVGVAAALTLPALADTTSKPASPQASDNQLSPQMLAALRRDLNLTAEQVDARLTKETWANKTTQTLQKTLGTSYAGAWLNSGANQLTVAVTGQDAAARVKATGAQAQLVSRSLNQLKTAKQALDRSSSGAPAAVRGWYVDPATNSVVVLAKSTGISAARSFVRGTGVSADAVRLVASNAAPRLLSKPSTPPADEPADPPAESTPPDESAPPADPDALVVRGGDPYFINEVARCSVGFSVVGGFISAGHCGQEGDTTTALDATGTQEVAQGTFEASTFPESDFSFVATNDQFTPVGEVNSFGGENASGASAAEQAQKATTANTFSHLRKRAKHNSRRHGGGGQQADPSTPPSDEPTDPSTPPDDPSASAAPPGDAAENLPVAGSEEAAIGTSVCKFGSTTGASCGVIQALDVTVQFVDPEGGPDPVTVNGLIQTDVCAEPGDSGGSLLAGDQAQGTVSGGSGDCTVGGQTFFQPINEVLQTLNLTLLTSTGGGGDGGADPSASATDAANGTDD